MIATGSIIRVGCTLIESTDNFLEASKLHEEIMHKLTHSANRFRGLEYDGSIFKVVKKLVLFSPPASYSMPPFPPTSSIFAGVCLDWQLMEDLAAESLFAVAEHSRIDVLHIANSLLMGKHGNFIIALMNALRDPPSNVEFSSQDTTACSGRCPIGTSCTPSNFYRPLMLPCGHGACAECWHTLLEHALQTSSTPVVSSGEDTTGTRSVNSLKCPVDVENKCAYKMTFADVQCCVPELASSYSNSVKRWFNRTITSGSFPIAICSCGASLLGRCMECEVECRCGRVSSIGDMKLGGSVQQWRPHPYSTCNTELEWRLLSTHGSSERIALMRSKKCPGCLFETIKCGCDPGNVVCNGLDRCPKEACNHLVCQKCKLDWCWICRKAGCMGCNQASKSSDLKERFNEGSKVVSTLESALAPLYISRFVLDDTQGGVVKIISVRSDAAPCPLPLKVGDVFSSINGIPVHNIADLMKAASSEHAVGASVLVAFRRNFEFHSFWCLCEPLPSGFSADAIIFKRSMYVHSVMQPQAQPLSPMEQLQSLCDVFFSLHSRRSSSQTDRSTGSMLKAVQFANSSGFLQQALQQKQGLSPQEAAVMLFLQLSSAPQ
jgi:hypothetical protein